jgi:RNA polymerase sigma factor (sigma-70 family)
MALQEVYTFSEKSSKTDGFHRAISRFDQFSEGELWDLFRSKDEGAFTFIYLKYFPVLYNYGRQFTPDQDLVKDVIQDLFIYLQEKRGGLSATTSIKFYLYKAYRNRIIRYLNRNRQLGEEVEYDENTGFEIALAEEASSLSLLLGEQMREKVEQAFAVLSKRQKEIIIYYFYEGFSYQEITSIMGFAKVDYTRILMSRSILKLRKELGSYSFILEAIATLYLLR